MTNKELKKISKYFSFVLRHQPDSIGLELNEQGWASIEDLIDKTVYFDLTREIIEVVVETNDKQRFCISNDGLYIRANQGHSIEVDLDLTPLVPPETLIHGTAEKSLDGIRKEGLKKMQRHHVHLTESKAVARSVGGRYGKPVLLSIDANAMHEAGFLFYKSANSVWLVDNVPAEYIEGLNQKQVRGEER